jgi:O-acetylserine/cysteine efflux transporter
MTPSHLALALVINLIWGFNFVASKYGVENFPPIFFTALRFIFIVIVLLPWLRPIKGKMTEMLMIAAVIGVIHYSLMFTGLALSEDISSVALVAQTNIPLATLLAVMFLGERIGWRRILALMIAFGGVMLIGFDPIVFNNLSSLAFVLAGAVAFAIGTILIRRAGQINVFSMNAWIAVVAAPGLFILSAQFESGHIDALESAGWLPWAAVAFSAIGASVVGHSGAYFLWQRYPVNLVSTLLLLTPVFGVIFGVIFWDDHLTWRLVLGGSATLIGVAIITVRSKPS